MTLELWMYPESDCFISLASGRHLKIWSAPKSGLTRSWESSFFSQRLQNHCKSNHSNDFSVIIPFWFLVAACMGEQKSCSSPVLKMLWAVINAVWSSERAQRISDVRNYYLLLAINVGGCRACLQLKSCMAVAEQDISKLLSWTWKGRWIF